MTKICPCEGRIKILEEALDRAFFVIQECKEFTKLQFSETPGRRTILKEIEFFENFSKSALKQEF